MPAAGNFDWLLRLGDKELEELCKEAEKKDPYAPLYAFLYTKQEDSDECPHEFDYESFDWNNVVKIEVSGNTCDTWDNRLKSSFSYVSIVFFTVAE